MACSKGEYWGGMTLSCPIGRARSEDVQQAFAIV
jgi:hypothetical protein